MLFAFQNNHSAFKMPTELSGADIMSREIEKEERRKYRMKNDPRLSFDISKDSEILK